MEMLNPHCRIDRDDRGVVRLTICNAGSLNILSSAVTDAVREGLTSLATDRDIRAVILAGQSEKSMIGGADIREMAKLDQKSAEAFITRLRDLCEAVRAFPAPVIARLPGWCLGGGLEVAAACDFRIAAHDARFGMPEVRVGIPSVIHAALLPRLIGWGRARWLVMTAENIDAPTALAWGLVNVVAPPAALNPASGLPSDPNVDLAAPVPSPDGHQIAFVSGGQVWIMNADGTRPTALTRLDPVAFPYSCRAPAWTRA